MLKLNAEVNSELQLQHSAFSIAMSYFSHLECSRALRRRRRSIPRASITSAPAALPCSPATTSTRRAPGDANRSRAASRHMWRYRELMPLFDGEAPVTLGEGWTPLIHARGSARTRPRRGSTSKTNRSTRPTRSRRAACPPRSRARRTRRADALGAVGRQRRQRAGRLCGRRRPAAQGLHADGREACRSSASASCTAPTSRSWTA